MTKLWFSLVQRHVLLVEFKCLISFSSFLVHCGCFPMLLCICKLWLCFSVRFCTLRVFALCLMFSFVIVVFDPSVSLFCDLAFLSYFSFISCFLKLFVLEPFCRSLPFCRIWQSEQSIAVYTSEFILLLLSAVTSSINISEEVPLAAIHAHAVTLPPPCLTDDMVCFRS